jgi:hypothetical protein
MRINDLGTLVADLSEEEAGNICGGGILVDDKAPKGLAKALASEERDIPGIGAEKGSEIASNDNGKKNGWVPAFLPGH